VYSSLPGDCVNHVSKGEMIFSEFFSQGPQCVCKPM
jgi:hypothetical protein